jgi:predicted peroxiredoxin
MRLLYIVTKGMEDPTLASVPLHIAANGSLEIGQEVWVVLAGDATELVIEDNIQRLRFPSTSERGALWPVGPPRTRRAWLRSTAGGLRPRTWPGSRRKQTRCLPSSA